MKALASCQPRDSHEGSRSWHQASGSTPYVDLVHPLVPRIEAFPPSKELNCSAGFASSKLKLFIVMHRYSMVLVRGFLASSVLHCALLVFRALSGSKHFGTVFIRDIESTQEVLNEGNCAISQIGGAAPPPPPNPPASFKPCKLASII